MGEILQFSVFINIEFWIEKDTQNFSFLKYLKYVLKQTHRVDNKSLKYVLKQTHRVDNKINKN